MLKAEIGRRLATDEKYAQAKARLEKLNTEMFFIRYGDYFSQTCNFLRQKLLAERKVVKNRLKRQTRKERKRAKNESGPSPQAKKGPHDTIEQEETATQTGSPPSSPSEMDEEVENVAKGEGDQPSPTTPMIDLLEKLTKDQSFIAYLQARRSITLYGKRNDLAHSHIAVMMKDNEIIKAASRVQEDLKDLAEVTCVDKSTICATEEAIFTTAKLFFKELGLDKETGTIYSMVPWPKDKQGNYVRNEDHSCVGYVEPCGQASSPSVDNQKHYDFENQKPTRNKRRTYTSHENQPESEEDRSASANQTRSGKTFGGKQMIIEDKDFFHRGAGDDGNQWWLGPKGTDHVCKIM
ncbi:hypothetical protein F4805DRAFT_478431 [Annulohypoxylon moriforme]|nr:hypothetical protein F4805DRAFT_478431 [Annulohypoxylon moriforme]